MFSVDGDIHTSGRVQIAAAAAPAGLWWPCVLVLGKPPDPGSGTANTVYCISNTNYEIKKIRMVDSWLLLGSCEGILQS